MTRFRGNKDFILVRLPLRNKVLKFIRLISDGRFWKEVFCLLVWIYNPNISTLERVSTRTMSSESLTDIICWVGNKNTNLVIHRMTRPEHTSKWYTFLGCVLSVDLTR